MLEINFDEFVIHVPKSKEETRKYQRKCYAVLRDHCGLTEQQFNGIINAITVFCRDHEISQILWHDQKHNTFKRLRGGTLGKTSGHTILYWLISQYPEYTNELEISLWQKPFLEFHKDQKKSASARRTAAPQKQTRKRATAQTRQPSMLSGPSAPFSWPSYLSKEDADGSLEDTDSGVWLNPHNHYSIPLLGRDDELEELDGFIGASNPFLICAVVASSGAGKTRLVSEWMKPYVAGARHSNWDAGVVKSRDASKWESWEIKRNTLIVIDYTYNYDDVIKTIIERCRYQTGYQVRLLVIDHIYPEKLFNDITWGNSASSGSDAVALQNSFLYKSSPINLKSEELNSNLLRHVIASVASLGEAKLGNEDEQVEAAAAALHRMGEQARNPDSVRHPLFAALMGQALRYERDFTSWSRQQLLDFYFSSHHRLPWMDGNDDEAVTHGLQTGAYIGAATLRRGVSVSTLNSCAKLEDQNITPLTAKRMIQLAGRIVSSKDQVRLEPFEPDILGENFLLKFLAELPGRSDLRYRFIDMLGAADDKQSEEECISNILATLQRVTRNLANDDQTSADVQIQWLSLKSFLEPKDFPENTPLRSAISIALVDTVKIQKAKQLDDLAFSFLKLINSSDLKFAADSFLSARSVPALINYFEQISEIETSTDDLKSILAASVETYKIRLNSKWNGVLLSSQEGSLAAANFFVFEQNEDVDATADNGSTALMIATLKGHDEIVKLLIAADANVNQATTDNGYTALMAATLTGHGGIVKLLIAADANVNQPTTDNGHTALMDASYYGHDGIVKLLIAADANVNQPTTDLRSTALMIATLKGHDEIVKLLIAADANVNQATTDNGHTALMAAALNGHDEIVKLLIAADANVNQATTDNGHTALMAAIMKGHDEIVKLLIAADANVNQATTDNGATALLMGAMYGNYNVMKLLIAAEANANQRSKDGVITALMIAQKCGHNDVVQLLLEASGHDIGETNK